MLRGPSELILNADHSIYHLNLHPEDIADTIITVGDPDRVTAVSKYFDTLELKKGKREFLTHTGTLQGKRLTVLSTGIGTDNIDIVLNELDALANIDFKTHETKNNPTCFQLVRIGTSGALQSEIPVDSFLLSEYALGFDGLLHAYESLHVQETEISEAFIAHAGWTPPRAMPYVVGCDAVLAAKVKGNHIRFGITATNPGFYAPQGRSLRLAVSDDTFLPNLRSFRYKNRAVTNLEMETSGLYGLAKLLGHQAVSMNCILVNRATGTFSKTPEKSIDKLIQYTLGQLAR